MDWELLLIDDGATDGSGALCDRLAEIDARIRVFHKPNGGVSSARNLGLDHARGEYVMFCDSDDWVEPTWCETMRAAIEQNPGCLPTCNYFRNTHSTETVNYPEQCDKLDTFIPKIDFFQLNRQELLGIPWNKIFSRKILEKQNIRFITDISLGEDLIFNLDYFRHIPGGMVFVNMPMYHYSQGATESLSAKYYSDLCGIYHTVYARIKEELLGIPGAWEKWQQEYRKSYFFAFDRVFRNTWSNKNTMSVFGKFQYNSAVFRSAEFQECRDAITKGYINILQHYGLKTNHFYIYWAAVAVSEAISSAIHKVK